MAAQDPQDEQNLNPQDDNQDITLGEVELEEQSPDGTHGANELLSVEHAIKTRILQSENLREELKKQKEMLKDLLENDPDYNEKSKVAQAAAKDKTAAKQRILNTPQGKALNQKVKDMQNEAKDIDDGLSYYLREYQRITGATQFEGDDGELREIVYTAKLVRKTNLNK
jgi:hypothetical protein